MGVIAKMATIFAGTVLLAACGGPAEFSSPLGPPAGSPIHERLVGAWALYDASSEIVMVAHMVADRKSGTLTGQLVHSALKPGADEKDVLWWRATGHVVELAGKAYLNFRRVAGKGDDYTAPGAKPGYTIARLIVHDENRLEVRFPRQGWLKEAAKSGRLKSSKLEGRNRAGEVPYDYYTVTTAELRRLIAEAGATAFESDGGTFHRIRRPDKP